MRHRKYVLVFDTIFWELLTTGIFIYIWTAVVQFKLQLRKSAKCILNSVQLQLTAIAIAILFVLALLKAIEPKQPLWQDGCILLWVYKYIGQAQPASANLICLAPTLLNAQKSSLCLTNMSWRPLNYHFTSFPSIPTGIKKINSNSEAEENY